MSTNVLTAFGPRGAGGGPSRDAVRSSRAVLRVREYLKQSRAAFVRIVGPPGAGKTTLVESTLDRLHDHSRIAVIVANPAADRDAALLRPHCSQAIPIFDAVPDPESVAIAVESIDPAAVDLILLEACGGIIPFPAAGEDAVVAVLGVSGGDDKAAEYASLVSRADAIVLTKTDLLPFIRFSGRVFHDDVRRINPAAAVMEVSTINQHGMDPWIEWLTRTAASSRVCKGGSSDCGPEFFVG